MRRLALIAVLLVGCAHAPRAGKCYVYRRIDCARTCEALDVEARNTCRAIAASQREGCLELVASPCPE